MRARSRKRQGVAARDPSEGSEAGKALGVRGDRDANSLILERLRAARPDDFILSEESVDDRARCAARRVWIVDPLDGTREYSEGLDDWAVHIGLAIDGRPHTAAVSLPALAQVYATRRAAFHPRAVATPPVVTAPRTDIARRVAGAGATLIPMGSAAQGMAAGRARTSIPRRRQYEGTLCSGRRPLAGGAHASDRRQRACL